MPNNPMEYFLAREASAKVRLLERNPSIAGFIDGVLDHLVQFCQKEGIQMEDIDLRDVFIAHDKRLNATITWRR